MSDINKMLVWLDKEIVKIEETRNLDNVKGYADMYQGMIMAYRSSISKVLEMIEKSEDDT